jgi:uncharacterized protein
LPFYFDTSALMKIVAEEAESAGLGVWIDERGERLVSSELARVELLRAVRRRDATLLPYAQELLKRTLLLALSISVVEAAGLLEPVSLRSLDALHLASALSLGPELDGLVTYDNRLAQAAEELGIRTLAPA